MPAPLRTPITETELATRPWQKWFSDIERILLSIKDYILPPATSDTLGGVKIGENIRNDDGKISVDLPPEYILPIATDSVLGGVKIGAGINKTADGTIHFAPEPPIDLPYTNASLPGVTEVKGALDALVAASGSSTLTKWRFIESTFEGNDSLDLHYSATGEFPGTVIATWSI
jgi:hypothetical protein